MLLRKIRSVIILLWIKEHWKKKGETDSIFTPQLQRKLMQFRKLWSNLCSPKWISPRRSRVSSLISTFWGGANVFDNVAFKNNKTFGVLNGKIYLVEKVLLKQLCLILINGVPSISLLAWEDVFFGITLKILKGLLLL